MDIPGTILELLARKRQLETIIATLEDLKAQDNHPGGKRRGRKFMGTEEREEVSKRMKRYWANRRKQSEKQQTS